LARKGVPLSEETKRKIGLKSKGRKHTEEARKKMSKGHKGKILSEEHKQNISLGNKGKIKHFSEEHKQNISLSNKGKILSEEHKQNISLSNKGKVLSKEHKQKIAIARKGIVFSEETRKKIGLKNKGKFVSEETRKKLGLKSKGRIVSEETKLKMSQIQKIHWANEDFAKSSLDKLFKSRTNGTRINKAEQKVLDLLNILYPNEWKFVGCGDLFINGKCPDFVNIDNNQIIELFGEYWHKNHNPEDRIKVFEPFGYKTLVVWYKELKHIDKLKEKINTWRNLNAQ
jgi:hypothetical protein